MSSILTYQNFHRNCSYNPTWNKYTKFHQNRLRNDQITKFREPAQVKVSRVSIFQNFHRNCSYNPTLNTYTKFHQNRLRKDQITKFREPAQEKVSSVSTFQNLHRNCSYNPILSTNTKFHQNRLRNDQFTNFREVRLMHSHLDVDSKIICLNKPIQNHFENMCRVSLSYLKKYNSFMELILKLYKNRVPWFTYDPKTSKIIR